MFNDLTALGYGLVTFAIIIGVGTVVLFNFGSAVSACNTTHPYNATGEECYPTGGNASDTFAASTATTNTNYLMVQLGQTGLAGWTPAIIAVSVGILFLGAFFVGRGNKGRY